MLTGAAQPPARCGVIFPIDEEGERFTIVPGVDNCFSCVLSNPQWSILNNADANQPITTATPIAGRATADVEGGHLVISMPQLYVLPGNGGRREIFCMGAGRTYNARLSSPGLLK